MGIWGSIIAGLFVYVGANFLMQNIVVGTSDVENILRTAVPITLACVVVGIMVNVFRA